MHTHLTTNPLMLLLPFHLRIACRRVANTWRESEHLLALTVLGAIVIVLIVPIAVIVWRAVR